MSFTASATRRQQPPPASASNRQLLPASATPRTRRQPLREASFGDAAGGLVESGQSATRRAIGRRIGATAAPCDADAAPFNDDFGDAAGEVVESKWRFLISMFSPATAVDVVNKLTASSNQKFRTVEIRNLEQRHSLEI